MRHAECYFNHTAGDLTLQVNLFIAVLKIKFAKAQTLFHSKLAKMSRKKRKNILGRVMEKSKNRIKDQVKKRREASEVRAWCCCLLPPLQRNLYLQQIQETAADLNKPQPLKI